ncbi:MAG: tripartite tricarboxylate transporter permease [Proteobacteria bacterium]|nr:tripartite tricarboxylate transporter permease [Pseudomonadota bacterium]MDA0995498.1 tripartite tricarboxylate transporter permease [Pseudomonadota bacterium]
MLDSLISAFGLIFSGAHFLYLLLGVVMGIFIGILPGLGGIVGFSILMPFIYGMDPVSALAMLIGLIAVIPTSDTFASVLMGIPGSSASQATVLDGFQLAKQGQAARALSAAFSASLFGGLFGALVLTLIVVIAKPIILFFGSSELFMLGILGISMVGVLSGDSFVKGFLACGVGLLLGTMGSAPATGEWRLTFGSYYLFDGLKVVTIGLAAFAVPEICDLLRKNAKIATKDEPLGKGWLQGLKDTIREKWIVLRCAGIGTMVGILPGLGGSVVDWIAYGHVVQTARDKSNFGKGDIRGVIAPESANNAKEGGGLVPTILFGIPGSGSMAVFLGGLTLLGIEPGPALIEEDLQFTYVMVWSLALANVIGAGMCFVMSSKVAKITTIPYGILAPFMIMIICFAAFQVTRSIYDLYTLIILGAFCTLMKSYNWPRPALLIGFVLSDTLETYLYQAVQIYDWNFLTRPGVITIFVITLISVFLGMRTKKEKTVTHSVKVSDLFKLNLETVFLGIIYIFFGMTVYDSFKHNFLGGVFPGAISLIMFIVMTYTLFFNQKWLSKALNSSYSLEDIKDMFYAFSWIIFLVVLVSLFGFIIGIVILFIAVMKNKTEMPLIKILTITTGGVALMLLLSHFMVLDFPSGLLQEYVQLPWPLK